MRLIRHLILVLGLSVALSAAPVRWTWDMATEAGTPETWNTLAASRDASIATPDGETPLRLVSDVEREALQWAPYLVFPTAPERIAGAGRVEIAFWIKGDASARIALRATDDRGGHLTRSRTVDLTGDWQRVRYDEAFTAPPRGRAPSVPRILLERYTVGRPVLLGPVSVVAHPAAPDDAPAHPPAEAPPGWRALDTSRLDVRAGSALDFTPFADPRPAGALGRVIVNPRGELAFADQPDTAVRFLSVQWLPPHGFRNWTDAQIAGHAAAIARQGYNLVRFHFLDNLIGGNDRAPALRNPPEGHPLPAKPEEIRWDAVALDRTHRFLAELKKRGVYWNIDLMTSYAGHANTLYRQSGGGLSGSLYNTKVRLFIDPVFRANWRAGAIRLLGDVNPHTGLPLGADPALALVGCLNEQEILVPHRDYKDSLDPAWHAYLKNKYASYAELHAAWGGRCGDVALPPADAGEIARDVPSINAVALTDTPAGRDMAEAIGGMEREVTEFYLRVLDEIRFPGLASNWNMRTRLASVPARSLLPVITMNQYHAHPRYGKNPFVTQDSALAAGGHSFKGQAVARFLDRPFVNTEFGHVFWNRYRHEQGLLHGAGAALQGWSGITRHANQVVSDAEPLTYFNAGHDPVSRASETVAAFLFRRGDVAPARHSVEIPVNDEFIFGGGRALGAIDDELSMLWPLVRVGIAYGERRPAAPATLVVAPDRTSGIRGDLMSSAVEATGGAARLPAIVARLRELGALGPDNRTDPAAGHFESDTGEVFLDTSAGGELRVRTPRFEGAVLKRDHRVELDALTIERCTGPASVALVSIDPDPAATLRDASRLLLVFSTDARNSAMRFTDAREDRLVDMGRLPVIARTAAVRVSLRRTASPDAVFRAYALHLDGERADEIPVVRDGDTLSLLIDTDRLPVAGPTPFFELVLEPLLARP